MSLRNSATRWGALSMLLHWVIVGLIITQFVLATIADDLPLGMQKLAMLARHKSVGITILVLALIRLAWRLWSPGPPLPGGLKPWERFLAHLTHRGLYLLIFLTPLAGWMMSSAKSYPVSWFNLIQLPDLVAPSDSAYRLLHEVHEVLAYSIAGLALLHAAAALKHHFILRDDILKRMLPFTQLLLGAVLVLGTSTAWPATWSSDPGKSTLTFSFLQAGARNTGRFATFSATVDSPGADLAGGRLAVNVDVSSLDTGDKDRDSLLRGADLFDAVTHPAATFATLRLDAKEPGRLEASGSLTIRGVTKPVKLLLKTRMATEAGQVIVYLTGSTTIRRLDFGVGQGDWKSTEWVGNEVDVAWSLRLTPRVAKAGSAMEVAEGEGFEPP